MRERSILRDVRRRFVSDRRANFAVMTALIAPLAIALAAVAVDEGSLYTERREAQSLADIAAITAAANIGNAEAAALATFRDNGLPSTVVQGASGGAPPKGTSDDDTPVATVVRGHYSPDPAIAAGHRFVPEAQPYNAVKVTLHKKGTLFFGSAIMAPPTISTTAIASARAQAAFSIGSRLAKVDGGILNALLGGLIGGSLSLNVMDYNALVDADVSALSFLDTLAVQQHLTAATYMDVLQSKATVGQIAAALANTAGVGQTGKLALQAIAARSTVGTQIPLERVIDLGSVGRLGLGQRPAGLPIDANALGMLTTAATLANGSHQVELDLGTTIPGLVSAKLDLAIGEPPQSPPWLTVGEKGSVVRTAQTRIKLTADVAIGNPNPVAGLALASLSLPVNVEVAYGEAEITDISCAGGRPENSRVTIAARPGIASLKLASSNDAAFGDFTKPQSFGEAHLATAAVQLKVLGITVLTLPLVDVTGRSDVDVGNTTRKSLIFNATDIANKKTITVTTSNYTESLTTSLLDNLDLHVSAVGLPLTFLNDVLTLVKAPVVAALATATKPVDELLYNLLTSVGIGLGQADVRVTGVTCGRAVLVQ